MLGTGEFEAFGVDPGGGGRGCQELPMPNGCAMAFRFELDPNVGQRFALAKHVGAARIAYNRGLARCLEALEEGNKIPSAAELHWEWNVWKREKRPVVGGGLQMRPQEAFRDLERAFKAWRGRLAGRPGFLPWAEAPSGRKVHWPEVSQHGFYY